MAERSQIELERKRALRVETHLKRAVKIATHFKNSHDKLKEENEALQKELAELKRINNAVSKNNIGGIKLAAIVKVLAPDDRKFFLNTLRKSIHPDKHNGLSTDIKNALGVLLNIIEGYFK